MRETCTSGTADNGIKDGDSFRCSSSDAACDADGVLSGLQIWQMLSLVVVCVLVQSVWRKRAVTSCSGEAHSARAARRMASARALGTCSLIGPARVGTGARVRVVVAFACGARRLCLSSLHGVAACERSSILRAGSECDGRRDRFPDCVTVRCRAGSISGKEFERMFER